MTDREAKIQAKYASKTRGTPQSFEHAAAIQAIAIARMMLSQHSERYRALIESKKYMDDVGGLLDPTLYLDALHSKSLKQQLRMAAAALAFLSEVDAVAAEIVQ